MNLPIQFQYFDHWPLFVTPKFCFCNLQYLFFHWLPVYTCQQQGLLRTAFHDLFHTNRTTWHNDILLMTEIPNNHLRCMKPYKSWGQTTNLNWLAGFQPSRVSGWLILQFPAISSKLRTYPGFFAPSNDPCRCHGDGTVFPKPRGTG